MATSTVLVIGSGGREHALAWRLQVGAGDAPRSDRRVLVCPGNAGIARELECLAPEEKGVPGFVGAAKRAGADLVVVGPEQPLVDGLADALQEAGIPVLGPVRGAARLEGSKAFMKAVASEAGVPTARYGVFERLQDAERFLDGFEGRVVVKADGLAKGKGVTVCESVEEAREVAASFLGEGGAGPRFGEASRRIVIEEFLPGLELSVIALCDGKRPLLFASCRDHKRLFDGDRGPNTGGMGAVCPLSPKEGVTGAVLEQVERKVLRPTLAALKARGTPYRGFLYGGLMLHEGSAKLLEFNVRFGDPEAEAVLFGTKVDLLPLFEEVAKGGSLEGAEVDLAGACQKTATVVCASPGYPEEPKTGARIEGVAEAEALPDTKLFFAGVRAEGDALVTSGGRVVACTGRGTSLEEALARAYRAADVIAFEGKQLRRDIGHTVLR